jgi:hypothetical protein
MVRIQVSADEKRLIADALRVFGTRLGELGTKRGGMYATKARKLADDIEKGKRE